MSLKNSLICIVTFIAFATLIYFVLNLFNPDQKTDSPEPEKGKIVEIDFPIYKIEIDGVEYLFNVRGGTLIAKPK